MAQGLTGVDDVKVIISVVTRGMQKAVGEMRAMTAAINKQLDPAMENLTQNTQNVNKQMNNMRKGFPVWAMSIMFFGMALRRLFDTIWKESMNTFNDVMSRIEGTVTGFTLMNDALTYLKFVAGQALEPLAVQLADIIWKISEWVKDNPEVTREIVKWGLILAWVMSIVGTLAMGWAAIKQVATGVTKTFMVFGKAGIVGKAFTWLAAAIGVKIVAALIIVAAVVAAVIALWKTDFGGFRDFIEETFGIIFITIKEIWNHLRDLLVDVWGLVMAVLEGDWDKAWEHMLSILQNIAALILKVLLGLGAAIVNIFVFAINFVTNIFGLAIDGMLWNVQKLAEQMDKVFGSNLASGVQRARNTIQKGMEGIQISYITADRVKEGMGNVDMTLGRSDIAVPRPQPESRTVMSEQLPNVYNNIVVEGNADRDVIDELVRKLNMARVNI